MRRTRVAISLPPAFSAPAVLPSRAPLYVSTFVCRTRFATTAAGPAAPCMVVHSSGDNEAVHTSSTAQQYSDYGGISSSSAQHDSPEHDEENAELTRNAGANAENENEGGALDARVIVGAVVVLFVLTTGGAAAVTGGISRETWVSLGEWFETLGPWGVVLYAGVYFLMELLALPALPLTLGSGYLFGVVKGTITASIAGSAAAAASFLIARYGLRNTISKLARQYPRFRAIDRAIGREGFKIVLLLRCSPLLPFAISNYLYGLTSVKFAEYLAGSWLGMLPGTIAYVSAGAAVNALTDLGAQKTSLNPALVVIGLAATAGALTTIGKIAAETIDEGEDEEVRQN